MFWRYTMFNNSYSILKLLMTERKVTEWCCLLHYKLGWVKYGRTPFVRINWDGKPSGYAENPDNWIFFFNRLHGQF